MDFSSKAFQLSVQDSEEADQLLLVFQQQVAILLIEILIQNTVTDCTKFSCDGGRKTSVAVVSTLQFLHCTSTICYKNELAILFLPLCEF